MIHLHYLVVAFALPVALVAPGYLLLRRRRVEGTKALAFGPGITIIVIGALAALALATPLSGKATSWLILLVLAGVTVACVMSGWERLKPGRAELVMAVPFIATYLFLVGFNAIPSNPPGSTSPCAAPTGGAYNPPNQNIACEFFAPASLAMNRIPNRSGDDLLQYRTAQAVWNRKLYTTSNYYGGWQLQDRTPLLGLTVAGLAGPAGASMPTTYPPQPTGPGATGPLWLKVWGAPEDSSITPQSDPGAFAPRGYTPPLVDDRGYWFYRIATIALTTLLLLPIWLIARSAFDARVATLASVAAGISPAIMLNSYYTSPKYLGVYFGLCGVLLVAYRRPALAGVALGAAYLCHPLGAIIAGAVALFQALRSLRGVVALAAAALVMAVPWTIFVASTAQTAPSLLSYPLGCASPGVTTDECLELFKKRTVSAVLWQRTQGVANSLVPFGLDTPLQPPHALGVKLKWLVTHDFSWPGMTGIAFFFFAIVFGLARAWRTQRRAILTLVVGQLAIMVLIWGVGGVAASIAGLGLLPFLYIAGAYGLTQMAKRVALWVYGISVAEWLAYIGFLFWPVDGIPVSSYLAGLTLILCSLAILVLSGLWGLGALGRWGRVLQPVLRPAAREA